MDKVIVQFNFPGLKTSQYDQAWEQLRAIGQSHPQGLIYHVSGLQGDNLIVCDVWESEQAFKKFSEILMPIVSKAGFPNIQPVITQVYYEYEGVHAGMTH
jgi:hypothetical protein